MTMFRTALNNKSLRHASVTKVTGALQRNLTFKNFFHRVLVCGNTGYIIENQFLVVVGFTYRTFLYTLWPAQRPGTDFFLSFHPSQTTAESSDSSTLKTGAQVPFLCKGVGAFGLVSSLPDDQGENGKKKLSRFFFLPTVCVGAADGLNRNISKLLKHVTHRLSGRKKNFKKNKMKKPYEDPEEKKQKYPWHSYGFRVSIDGIHPLWCEACKEFHPPCTKKGCKHD